MVDGDSGNCGYRRKANNAKNSLARGVIIINDGESNADLPYSKSQDGTFPILLADAANPDAKEIVKQEKFLAWVHIKRNTEIERSH